MTEFAWWHQSIHFTSGLETIMRRVAVLIEDEIEKGGVRSVSVLTSPICSGEDVLKCQLDLGIIHSFSMMYCTKQFCWQAPLVWGAGAVKFGAKDLFAVGFQHCPLNFQGHSWCQADVECTSVEYKVLPSVECGGGQLVANKALQALLRLKPGKCQREVAKLGSVKASCMWPLLVESLTSCVDFLFNRAAGAICLEHNNFEFMVGSMRICPLVVRNKYDHQCCFKTRHLFASKIRDIFLPQKMCWFCQEPEHGRGVQLLFREHLNDVGPQAGWNCPQQACL